MMDGYGNVPDNKVRNLKGEIVGYVSEWYNDGKAKSWIGGYIVENWKDGSFKRWVAVAERQAGEELSFPVNMSIASGVFPLSDFLRRKAGMC